MQVERERYSVQDYQRRSLQELIELFNSEYAGVTVRLPTTTSKCIIETIRSSAENEEGLIIKQDKSVVVSNKGRIPIPDSIEIEASSRDRIKAAKQSLIKFLEFFRIDAKTVVIKETREEQATKAMAEAEGREAK